MDSSSLPFDFQALRFFAHKHGAQLRLLGGHRQICFPHSTPPPSPLRPACAEHGLRPADVYGGGGGGAIAQLEALEAWFAVQRDFHFYSSSGESTGGVSDAILHCGES